MRKKIFILSLVLISAPVLVMAQNKVAFFEEYIDFKLDSTFFCINGIYSFHNNSNEIVNQQITFPFAVKADMIDSIRITDLNSLKTLRYRNMENAVSFDLKLPPKETLDINIFYRQKASVKNSYIITTTQYWGKPLDKAIYTLTVPEGMTIGSFSYTPDSMRIIGDERLYKWEKYHFSPQIDFDIVIAPESIHKIGNFQPKGSSSESDSYCDKYFFVASLPNVTDDFIKQALICSKKCKKPILLFFTAWSASDRTVDKILMLDKTVNRYLRDHYITVVLKTDDKTKLPANDQKDTILFDKPFKINTTGSRNLFYQISKFKVNTWPFMAILNEKEDILLKPIGYTINRNEILRYLENGIKEYSK